MEYCSFNLLEKHCAQHQSIASKLHIYLYVSRIWHWSCWKPDGIPACSQPVSVMRRNLPHLSPQPLIYHLSSSRDCLSYKSFWRNFPLQFMEQRCNAATVLQSAKQTCTSSMEKNLVCIPLQYIPMFVLTPICIFAWKRFWGIGGNINATSVRGIRHYRVFAEQLHSNFIIPGGERIGFSMLET